MVMLLCNLAENFHIADAVPFEDRVTKARKGGYRIPDTINIVNCQVKCNRESKKTS